jgi:hypothetical protein
MWKDKYIDMHPEDDKTDKVAFFVSIVGTIIAGITTESPALMVIVSLILYIGIRWIRAV